MPARSTAWLKWHVECPGQPHAGIHPGALRRLTSPDPQSPAAMRRAMAEKYLYIMEIDMSAADDEESVVGRGCDW
jgi:hypothetical protein